ncbi:MAG: putative alpha-1,2-mannosidase [Bacteroidia bacterium]|jgi:predicted alpha-1,2-mannosidase
MNLKSKTLQIILLAIVCTAVISSCEQPAKETPPMAIVKENPVDMVYPFLDAANSRWFFFSSACRPFGLVNLSPDMKIDGAWNSGYRYDEDTIKFFSHVHAWQLSGIPVMPTTGDFKGHLGPDAYGSLFSHEEETVFPGYHQVKLKDYDINAELTSTTRVGFHRYTFGKNDQNSILLDLGTVLGPSPTKSGHVGKLSDKELNGHALMTRTHRRPKDTYVYFHIELQEPFSAMNAWQDGKLLGETSEFDGENGGVYLTLSESAAPVLMKVGISYVSAEQAKLNIDAELNHWDFDKVVEDSKEEWNSQLGRIAVEGNDEQQRRRFYTDLWKSLQGRRIISDANGKYCDMTGDAPRIGQIPLGENGKPKFNHFNSDSFWGAQWTITTLWELVYPEIAEQFVNSMLLMYDDGGLIPRGPSGGNYTHVMTGASSTPFIVGAYMKGIRNYNVEKAYEGMKKNHLLGGTMGRSGYEHNTEKGGGLEYYIDRGYIPYPLEKKWAGHQEGAGQTLEYSYQDWCLAQMAKALGKDDDYEVFMRRSNNWKNLFDNETKWIRPKNHDGSWKDPFDPFEVKVGFVEASAAQSTWYVPHDLPSLAEMMGGSDAAADILNESFETSAKLDFTSGKSHSSELNDAYRKIPINYGNQPSIETAFVFNHIGRPEFTQKWSREIVDKVFGDLSPKFGFSGDEDQGLMGSLSALMKMGLFEMKSGAEMNPKVDIGSPIFDKITIQLNKDYYKGDKIEIVTKNNSKTNMYVQKLSWNNLELSNMEIEHSKLTAGGVLELEMGGTPKMD